MTTDTDTTAPTAATGQPPIRPGEIAALDRAMAWLQKNWRNASLAELAAEVGISQYHLQRRFKLHFGKSPKEVMSELQIAEAKRLLLAGHRCRAVAEQCGFACAQSFGNKFRAATGTPPARWLKQQSVGDKTSTENDS